VKGQTLRLLLSALAFMQVTGVVLAQHVNAPDSPCREAASTLETAKCFDQALQTADANLNKTYGRVQRVLDASERQQLLRAQRLWIRFRDATCDAEAGLYGGGSGGSPARLACREAQTRFREADLLKTYDWILQKREIPSASSKK
jgi:uncharacterized protein YecT (DUF1311 family)